MKTQEKTKISALQAETHDSDAFQGAVNSILSMGFLALVTAILVMALVGCTPYDFLMALQAIMFF